MVSSARVTGALLGCAIVFGLFTIYARFLSRIPKTGYGLVALCGVFAICGYVLSVGEVTTEYAAYALIGLATLEIFRVFIGAGRERWRERWIAALGNAVFMLGLVFQVLVQLSVLPPLSSVGPIILGTLLVSVCFSIDLSRNFARTSKNLESQLKEVKHLSRKAIENERLAKEEELARRMLESDNARKTTELEEARQVQLSTYAQAQEAVERIFTDLERGIPPSPEATKAIVSTVLEHVLSDHAAMATPLAIQKIKQFDRSLTTHALDTCILSLIVALESGLDQPTQELVGMGALLHDTGYVRLPRKLVRKRDECTGQDKTLLEQHCKLGVAVLAEQPGMPEDVLRIVKEQHEWSNGRGFPAALQHDQTSQLAQIVGIVDFYDGMVSRRGTRPSLMPHDAVRQLFLAGERGQFEKALVDLMIRSIGVYPVGSLVRLNTGEQAVVVGVNPQQRLKPLVKITTDPQGGSYPTPVELDLAAPSTDHTVRSVLRVLDPTRERVNIGIHLDNSDLRAA